MAKTITVNNTRITGIHLNLYKNNKDEYAGHSSQVHYQLEDTDGKVVSSGASTKFTQGATDQLAERILTDAPNKLVTDFVNAMQKNMDEREEL